MKPLIAILLAAPLLAENPPESRAPETRAIVPEEVIRARPAADHAVSAAAPKPKYIPVSAPAAPRPLSAPTRELGVTLWRLRPAAAQDAGERLLVQESGQSVSLLPERVPSNAVWKEGDRVRLSIESPVPGYLYVVDREIYADGAASAPVLIFPTSLTRNGDNRVSGGKLIDIPAQDDRLNCFAMRRNRPGAVAEELTLILTAETIPGLATPEKAVELPPQQVAAWERNWGSVKPEAFELSGGAGKPWTGAEQQASAAATRRLTKEDPLPQTIYRIAAPAGAPVVIRVKLAYGR